MLDNNCKPHYWLQAENPIYTAPSKDFNDFGNCMNIFPTALSFFTYISDPILATLGCISLMIVVRKVLAFIVGSQLFPGTQDDRKSRRESLEIIDTFKKNNSIEISQITLSNSSCASKAFIVFSKRYAFSNKWCLEVPDTSQPLKNEMKRIISDNLNSGYHSLILIPPKAWDNVGQTTRFQWGAGVDAGLSFLEEKIEASQICLKGTYYGAGCLSEGLLQHDFEKRFLYDRLNREKETKYTVVFRNAFTKLTDICDKFDSAEILLSYPLLKTLGLELDNVKAVDKLSKLRIPLCIISPVRPEDLPDEAKYDLMRYGIEKNLKESKLICLAKEDEHEKIQSFIEEGLRQKV